MNRTERGARCTLQAEDARPTALVHLIAIVGLAVSTIVAVTVVSIGIARADVFGLRGLGDPTPLAVAVALGLLLSAMGGLTAALIQAPARQAARSKGSR